MSSLRETFVEEPESELIAALLNVADTCVCEHGRNPCHLWCGVRTQRAGIKHEEHWEESGEHFIRTWHTNCGEWVVIPYEERVAWLERVETMSLSLTRAMEELEAQDG